MNILGIKYFLAIAEEGSISAAARKLYISQQALSEHLKKLETEMGTPLFKRGKEIKLTVAGQCFLEGSRDVMKAYNRMIENIENVTKNRRASITVAIPTSFTPLYLSDILMRFQSKHPEYRVEVLKRQHSDILHHMSGVDLYWSGHPLCDGLKNYIILESDPYCVVFQKSLAESVYGERWESIDAQLRQTGDLSLLREMPFLILRDKYGQMTENLQLIFNEHGFEPKVALNSENSEINNRYCIAGKGCLLAPESAINLRFFFSRDPDVQNLLSYPIRVTSFETKLAISYEKEKQLHAAEISFINEVVDYFKKY